ncbi:MAG: 50S ribosomal protein L11 methyltransferase [Deltaproteobacteria bacterium]|nr:50S ribosomal protein L11 methyltransferase [Deltaproteobacteria bacterium]
MEPTTWHRLTVSAPPEVREALAALLVDWGAAGTAEETGALSAWFRPENRPEIQARLERYALDLGAPVGWRWDDEPEDGWRDRWKAFYRPARISERLGVCPTWEEWPGSDPGVRVIRLDPGRAFGTGTHETTRLCLGLLDRALSARPGAEVLDVGCGSGILSIGALLLGARRAVALDIDPMAAQAARENARRNGVDDRLRVVAGDLRAVGGTYPLVVANILYQVLLGLAPELSARVEPGGALILSGLLTQEAASAEAVYGALGLRPESREVEGEWAAVVLRRSS